LTYSLLTLVLWAGWALAGAAAAQTADVLVVQAISAIGVAPVAVLFWYRDARLRRPRTVRGIGLGLTAGLLAVVGQVALLFGLAAGGPTSIVYPLTGMYPLVTVVIAVLLMRERMHGIQWGGVAAACCAIYLFSQTDSTGEGAPGSAGSMLIWIGCSLAALACFGVVAALQKLATREISVELCTACFCGAFIPFALGIVAADRAGLVGPFSWNPGGRAWGISVLYGLLLGGGTLAQFAAFNSGKASVVTPLTALYPAIVAIAAVPLFGDRPSALIWGAIALSLLAAAALSTEERPAWLNRVARSNVVGDAEVDEPS